MQGEKNTWTVATAAAVVPPVLLGTYTYDNGTGVATLTITTGANANLAIGDILVDLSLGASAVITAVDTGAGTATIKSGLSGIFNGGNFAIHKIPANLATVGKAAKAIGSANPVTTIEWSASNSDLTSFVVRPYVWSVRKNKWGAKGDGTVTVSTDADYRTQIRGVNPMVNYAGGSVYDYNNTTGAITGVTYNTGYSIDDVVAGSYFYAPATNTSTQILAVDRAGTIYVAASLGAAAMTEADFVIRPIVSQSYVYWNFSTVTGTGVASVEWRVGNEAA
jgi:hypothetical protein